MKNIYRLSILLILLSSCLIPESTDIELGESNLPLFIDESFLPPDKEPCLCQSNGSAASINREKTLLINDQSLMAELNSDFGFHHLLNAMKPTSMSFHVFARSYLDGYNLSSIPSGKAVAGEQNDLRARTLSRQEIENNWPKDGSGKLSSKASPYRLLSILYRPELVDHDSSGKLLHGGEFRFIYKFLPEGQTHANLGDKQNHIILEYKLPFEAAKIFGNAVGGFSRVHWLRFISKLNCLSGDQYKDHLKNIIRRVAFAKYSGSKWINGSALGQFRVNDFLNPNTPGAGNPFGQDWVLFEYRLARSGKLERHRMPKTPKDNFSNDPSSDIKNAGLVNLGSQDVVNFIASNFDRIKDENKDYEMPDRMLAWQNDYDKSTSWGTLLNNNSVINSLSPAHEKSFAKYRFSLNTCQGCHGGTFASNQNLIPNLATTAASMGKSSIDFSMISAPINFLHVNKDGLPTIFLLEDLQNRKEELEFQLAIHDCVGN